MRARGVTAASLSFLLLAAALAGAGCGGSGDNVKTVEPEVLAGYPADSMDGVITRTGIEVDRQVSSDGGGSLKATAEGPTTFNLYEVAGLDVEDARLIYRAHVRTQDVQGRVFLEMWVEVPGLGQFFSRGLDQTLSGTSDWATLEAPFFLQPGQTADLAKLNLVIEGSGTAWIDDIELIRGPL